MHSGQDPEDLQDHRSDQGLPDPCLGRGGSGRRSLNLTGRPVQIEIPGRSAYVGIVRLAIGSLARSSGLDEERVDDMRIAVSEACTNAVFTNEESGSDHPVTVAWLHHPDRIEIEISDRGVPPEKQPDLLDSQGFSSRLVMSTALLQELADELLIEPAPEGGTRVRLTFRTEEEPIG